MFPRVKKIIDGVPLVRFMIECAVDRTAIYNIESARFSTLSSNAAEREREDAASRRLKPSLKQYKVSKSRFPSR